MSWKSADQVAAEYEQSMGVELGRVFHALATELVWIHWEWRQYRILFGDRESRLELLNEAAPFFFRVVQDALFESTILGIARFAGHPQSVGKQNLAVTRLPPLIQPAVLRAEVADLVTKARAAAEFAFDWRNRHIAHRDLSLALGQSARPLEAASRQHIETALEALRAAMNHVEAAFRNATTAYAMSPGAQDAETLLYVLRDGLRFDRERQARWDRGELHEDDLKPPASV